MQATLNGIDAVSPSSGQHGTGGLRRPGAVQMVKVCGVATGKRRKAAFLREALSYKFGEAHAPTEL